MYAVLQRLLFFGISLDMLDVVLPILGGDFNTVEQVAIPPFSFTMSSIQSMWLATLVKMPGADWEKTDFLEGLSKVPFLTSLHWFSISFLLTTPARMCLSSEPTTVSGPPLSPYLVIQILWMSKNLRVHTSQVAECLPLAQSENCSSMSSFEYRDRHLLLSTRETLNISNSKMVFNYILSLIFPQQKFQLKIHHLCLLKDVCCVRIVSLSPS